MDVNVFNKKKKNVKSNFVWFFYSIEIAILVKNAHHVCNSNILTT